MSRYDADDNRIEFPMGNGREGYLKSQAAQYEEAIAIMKEAHKASAPTFKVWDTECPILFGSYESICIVANDEGFQPSPSVETAKETGLATACFQTKGWKQASVENEILDWAKNIALLKGCWE